MNNIAVLPAPDEGTVYRQMPLESIDKNTYDSMYKLVEEISLDDIAEEEDFTSFKEQAACSAGGCDVDLEKMHRLAEAK